jgi:hypothetical protein
MEISLEKAHQVVDKEHVLGQDNRIYGYHRLTKPLKTLDLARFLRRINWKTKGSIHLMPTVGANGQKVGNKIPTL